ncbi:zinc-dependent alcohol dehydrogenase family protein [Hirschia baltica]|uniref:Alcohol dehydrogenase zinc-binding domain protein n=1 Tax=Hirschia baltica (strain ATCC 49814 / DSM 5838 / IFAM 1418) TaxID=582402 RepID=C6XJ86_HIRBI|nr:NAD(P)-dependent alcohol dehydrogenase [Hirschia baltica]ACT59181.1 Alcohol dehydrogenase zinc-binding domain protein [Hirschia baltica ATCC 49814]
MKAYHIGAQAGISSLTAVEVPEPKVTPGNVIVRVKMVCLNHRDVRIICGEYGPKRPADRIPNSEGVGCVEEVGSDVTGFVKGDRVIAPHFVSWSRGPFFQAVFARDVGVTEDGWLAEFVSIPASALVKVPDSLSDQQVVPLSAAGLTAWNALVEIGKIKAGDKVVTLGTGGVSIAAMQIAKMHGAKVCVTSSSDEKLDAAKRLGADVTVNYRETPEWGAAVFDALNGGADIVVDTAGQATLAQSINAAAPLGRIAIIGALAGAATTGLANYGSIIGKNLGLYGVAAGSREMLCALVNAAAENQIEPVIDRVFPFEQTPEAYSYLEAGGHMGKVLVEL